MSSHTQKISSHKKAAKIDHPHPNTKQDRNPSPNEIGGPHPLLLIGKLLSGNLQVWVVG